MKKCFIALAAMILILPLVLTPFGTDVPSHREEVSNEISMSGFSTRLALKTLLIDLNDRLLAPLGGSGSDQVIRGKSSWLFYTPTLDGSALLTGDEEDALIDRLLSLQSALSADGRTLILLIAPNKASVYPEFLPAGFTTSGLSTLENRLADAGLTSVRAVDALTESKGSGQLYFTSDTHWNARGALIVFRRLADLLPSLKNFDADFTSGTAGDLLLLCRPGADPAEADAAFNYARSWTAVKPIRSRDDLTIETRNVSGTGTILLARDSFGRLLLDPLAESASRLIMVRTWENLFSLAADYDAGIVILEVAERDLRTLLTSLE